MQRRFILIDQQQYQRPAKDQMVAKTKKMLSPTQKMRYILGQATELQHRSFSLA
jgi:hypothetical protein